MYVISNGYLRTTDTWNVMNKLYFKYDYIFSRSDNTHQGKTGIFHLTESVMITYKDLLSKIQFAASQTPVDWQVILETLAK